MPPQPTKSGGHECVRRFHGMDSRSRPVLRPSSSSSSAAVPSSAMVCSSLAASGCVGDVAKRAHSGAAADEAASREPSIEDVLPQAMLRDVLSRLPDAASGCVGDMAKRAHTGAAADEAASRQPSIEDVLPEAMLMEVLSRLPDARNLVNCAAVSNAFRSGFRHVNRVWFLCKLVDIRRGDGPPTRFKDSVVQTLRQMMSVELLRLEIEDEMQTQGGKDDHIEQDSLWLSEHKFIDQWLPHVSHSLRNLTVIDYGQQAIYHATSLLQLLAQNCKQLRTLELRNMYLNCGEVEKMSKLTTLTLRCVKLFHTGLKELNDCMPQLETLTLVTVVGLQEAEFSSEHLKVMCLGLATRVKSVRLRVPCLEKLQLKMACPDTLIVNAQRLQCLAVCMDKRKKTVQYENVKNLRELLMGASDFSTLVDLSASNAGLEKMFLDVPCMAFDDSGVWRGVIDKVVLDVPDMNAVRQCCPLLHTLSVGPGLWYAMEKSMDTAAKFRWPDLRRLIVHLIVQFNGLATSLGLLTSLVHAMPSLALLEVYVHADSGVDVREFYRLKELFPRLDLHCDSWKKGLRFECFSF